MNSISALIYGTTNILTERNTSGKAPITGSIQGVGATQISKMPEQVRQASDNKYMRLS
jgi:hypothetical protein